MSLDTIMKVESALDCSILKVGNKLANADMTLSQVIQVIYYALRGGGNDIKETDVKAIVSELGLIEAIKTAGELITMALKVDDDSEVDSEKKSES
tara:strand:+ start:141 stop:425 length:285 start_codon:yes stop_codon:yes gene_type:complete